MKGKFFFCKNKHHIGVVHVPSFHLSARSSSFFRAFFLHFHGEPFYGSPDTLSFISIAKKIVVLGSLDDAENTK